MSSALKCKEFMLNYCYS